MIHSTSTRIRALSSTSYRSLNGLRPTLPRYRPMETRAHYMNIHPPHCV